MNFRHLAWVLVLCALAACNNEKPRKLIDERAEEASAAVRKARENPAEIRSYNPLRVTDKIWAGSVSMRMRHGLPVPQKYEGPHGITIVSAENMTLGEIAATVGAQTGIPVRLATGLSGTVSNSASASLKAVAASASSGMPLSYEGSLSGLLDLVASNYGVSWTYDGGAINVTRYETRVFVVEALPGTQSIKDGMKEDESSGSSSSSSGSAGGSYSASSNSSLQQSSSMSAELKVWDEINQTIKAMIEGQGNVVVSPSSGTVTVTTTPENMLTVAKYIQEENKRLSQQVAVNVEIYAVSMQEGTDFAMSFNTALRRLSDLGGNISSASGPSVSGTSGFSSGGQTYPGSTVTNGASLGIAILNPNHTGQITSLFSALTTIGNTSRVAQFPMITLNNRPASRRVGQDQTYIATTSSTSSLSSSSDSVTPGTIREGFSIQVTPRILEDGRILLQYSFSLMDLIKYRTATTASQTIELPETASRVFVQQALLKSGSTLIVGGYDDEQASLSSQGVGSAFNYLLGGGSANSTAHMMLFIAITPQVLDVPRGDHLQ